MRGDTATIRATHGTRRRPVRSGLRRIATLHAVEVIFRDSPGIPDSDHEGMYFAPADDGDLAEIAGAVLDGRDWGSTESAYGEEPEDYSIDLTLGPLHFPDPDMYGGGTELDRWDALIRQLRSLADRDPERAPDPALLALIEAMVAAVRADQDDAEHSPDLQTGPDPGDDPPGPPLVDTLTAAPAAPPSPALAG